MNSNPLELGVKTFKDPTTQGLGLFLKITFLEVGGNG